VLVSGSGSNLQAIIDRLESGGLNARIACVISDNPDAFALTRAKAHSIPAIVHEKSGFKGRREYDTALVDILRGYGVELVVLAGFMRILSDVMVNAFPAAIMNIHPALLPSFPGLHAQQQALDYGVKLSGCTVHFVDCGTDTGPIILQAVVPVKQDDTEERLSARIQAEEHRTFPEAVRLFVEGRISVDGRRVRIQV
jgi:phosphoribosylglycinamide formyltransferase-1